MKLQTSRLAIQAATDAEMRAMQAEEPNAELKAAYGEMLAGCQAHPEARLWYTMWLIYSAGEQVGELCFKGLPPEGVVEIGYGIREEHRGKGYATEAVSAMARWASGQPGVKAVEAETEASNTASRRVLEKSGFLPTGQNGEEGPRFVWSETGSGLIR